MKGDIDAQRFKLAVAILQEVVDLIADRSAEEVEPSTMKKINKLMKELESI